ncbi:MAG TPA: DUF475 domain-containing protein [Candidatus Saccharimonadales bacterium]|jgi:hypothetical protein|nr:DUF475 domain-containing protein [Candidatus Saccharimonadales bacterium]
MPKHPLLHHHSPFRIFIVPAILTFTVLGLVLQNLGTAAVLTTLILGVIELTFSFDNAIINARTLVHLSPFWQRMFLTVGILIAVFGMRILFPILVVAVTGQLSFNDVIHLAFDHPDQYALVLGRAHPSIAAFGGAFLAMLGLSFFFEDRTELWIKKLEKFLQRISRRWLATGIVGLLVIGVGVLPFNHHRFETLIAGIVGIGTYLIVHGLTDRYAKKQTAQLKGTAKLMGMAGLFMFIYLEILDASFSFDGVIGAFAITDSVVLIAAGLGIGALWVRSLTVYMVRKGTLKEYVYLEHGAHYTILVLATLLVVSLFVEVPEAVSGSLGIGVIVASVISSILHRRRQQAQLA